MDNETAKMIQKAIEMEWAALSLEQVKGMTKVKANGIEDDVYVYVADNAEVYIARVFKKCNGQPENVLVKSTSLATIEIPLKIG